jgi:hypothetical protein
MIALQVIAESLLFFGWDNPLEPRITQGSFRHDDTSSGNRCLFFLQGCCTSMQMRRDRALCESKARAIWPQTGGRMLAKVS